MKKPKRTSSHLFRSRQKPRVALPSTLCLLKAPALRLLRFWAAVFALLLLGPANTFAAAITATYTTGAEVPLTASNYTPAGDTVELTLNYPPTTGTRLMVVNNTGTGFIPGTFSNLAQGQTVALAYNGVTYHFVANYYGGTGNDLVLVWKATRAFAWGENGSGQLGNNSLEDRVVPMAVTSTGVLAGKTVVAASAGASHSVALCSDGTVAAWGSNGSGQLGNNSITYSLVPVAASLTGVLADKTVVAVAAGGSHSVALCSDGTVAAWGSNGSGQLGNNSFTSSSVPVQVTAAGVLAGKTVVAVAAGGGHSVALCSDGTVAAWGLNIYGQLGDNSTNTAHPYGSAVPVAVVRSGVLGGKTVVAVAAGSYHGMALCSDGTVAAWGSNYYGQLGNNSLIDSPVPVIVTRSGVLSLKAVVAVAAGRDHSMALCSDGTIAAWGCNDNGQLGDDSVGARSVPVAVTRSGVLTNRFVGAIAAGDYHSVALCPDGTLAAWGRNNSGQLGNNNTTDSRVPVAVTNNTLAPGERFTGLFMGSQGDHSLALVAASVPTVITPVSTAISSTTTTLGGTVLSEGGAAITGRGVVFAPTATNSNPQIGGTGVVNLTASGTTGTFTVSAANLTPGRVYTFAAYATNTFGTQYSSSGTFSTVGTNAGLSGFVLSTGTLSPAFTTANSSYTGTVPMVVSSLTVTPTAVQANATIQVNNATVTSGTPSGAIPLNVGSNTITTVVTAQDGVTTRIYSVTVNRVAVTLDAIYNAGIDVPATANGYVATGSMVNFTLNYAPEPGSRLVVVNTTGAGFITGTFSNLAQGQTVALAYNGVTYHFVANYYGGTGNDLVLVWKATRASAWGGNSSGQLGNNSTTYSSVPVGVMTTGVLRGKTVLAVAAGQFHSIALCSDGTVAAWGNNGSGQLGNNSTTNSAVPVAVTGSGVLAGKTVVAVAAGSLHALALCSDGTVAAWGSSYYGQLGNDTTGSSSVPVAVSRSGVLSSKTVVAVAAGGGHSLVVCSDGTVAAWGDNSDGQLGKSGTYGARVPVAVTSTGVLAGKTVLAVAAGDAHSLALCSDGTTVAWGNNGGGQLGNNSTTRSSVPVAVTNTGVLAGKTVVAVAAGRSHSMALCSDGTLAAWGNKNWGQLGDIIVTNSSVPAWVPRNGALFGRTVVAIAAGDYHSMALCSDGTVAAWGLNDRGQLGNNNTDNSAVPVAAISTSLAPGTRFTGLFAGSVSSHSLALVTGPAVPDFTSPTSAGMTTTTATLGGTIISDGGESITGRGVVYVPTATNSSPQIGGTGVVNAMTSGTTGTFTVDATGLSPGTAYTFATYASNNFGTSYSSTGTFTTLSINADLSGFALNTGTLSPSFTTANPSYTGTVPMAISSLTVTPTAVQANATIQVNNATVTSGTPSGSIPLNVGSNTITTVVTAQDGFTTRTYTATVNRVDVALSAVYSAGTDMPVTVNGYAAKGSTVDFTLNYAPEPGTRLMVVNNTGLGFITGTFSNLAQGQAVALVYNGVTSEFVANYYGGTGNDLVLAWKATRAYAWGFNEYGQMGNDSLTNSSVPVAVTRTGVLEGKTVVAVAAGGRHSVALCSDGTVATWGITGRVPVAVTGSGVLAGKTVVALAAGDEHTLTLNSDGTVAAWGGNNKGQLGDNSFNYRNEPVAVMSSGVLAGKTVVAVAAGGSHSLALCSDGTVAAWGANHFGQLGTNTPTDGNSVPLAVMSSGVLSGKTVVAVAAGYAHSMALCSDGTLAAWGWNYHGQLGNNSTNENFSVPVAVVRGGVLSSKTVVTVAAGGKHSLALCSDGTVAAWGANDDGDLGNNSTSDSSVPVAVTSSGVLAGKTVVAVAAASDHSLALCSDGTVASWGSNLFGMLGNDSWTGSLVPVVVTGHTLAPGERFTGLFAGSQSYHNLALVAAAPSPDLATPTSASITATTATLGGTVLSEGGTALTGRGLVYAPTATNTNPQIGGTGVVNLTDSGTGETFTVNATGLTPVTAYTFAAYATNSFGTTYSSAGSLTTLSFSALETWRQTWFGTSASSGNAADSADPYGTGVPNLAVFAFFGPTQNPAATTAGNLPQPQLSGGNFTYTFTEPSGVSGIIFGAEWSTSLEAGSWQTITDTGNPPQHTFSVPVGTNTKILMRLRVRNQ